jgi:cytochrome P450
MATPTTEPVRLPPGPRAPKIVQGIGLLIAKHGMFAALGRWYGSSALTMNFPVFGRTVVISDPILVKDLFTTSSDLVERPTEVITMGALLGPGSMFSLAGGELLERRRLLVPPFHGKRVRSYEHIIEDEVMREIANWPEGREFETLQPMLRITLGAILRAVFGAKGSELEELRGLLTPAIRLGFRLVLLPPAVRRDLGPWSPGGGFCSNGAGLTLSSTRSSPMRGPTRPSRSATMCSRCWCRPATRTVSRSRIGRSPTSC